jgi:hypothetical protein
MRVFCAITMIALLAGPAYAQSQKAPLGRRPRRPSHSKRLKLSGPPKEPTRVP